MIVKKGGGVLIYSKNSLKPHEIKLNNDNQVESLCIEIEVKGNKIKLMVIYRPPNQKTELDDIIYEQMQSQFTQSEIIVMGDFNFPIKSYENNNGIVQGAELLRNLKISGYRQLVDFPTRGDNFLDLIFTTNNNLTGPVKEFIEYSDHKSICFDILLRVEEKDDRVIVPNFSKANFRSLNRYIRCNMSINDQTMNCTEMWNVIKSTILEAQDKFIPTVSIKRSSKPHWFTTGVNKVYEKKQKLYKIYRKWPTEANKARFNNANKQAKKSIKKGKKIFENRIAQGCNSSSKKFFQYVNSKRVSNQNIVSLEDADGNLITDGKEMAKILNDYFSSVFIDRDSNTVSAPVDSEINETLIFNSITIEDIKQALDNLKPDKAKGHDGIYARTIIKSKITLAPMLLTLFSKSITTGEVPNDFKLANVIPIHKKGSKTNPSNYRPISLTSIIGKMLESIIKRKIVNHLENLSLISDSQHGFRTKRSCLTNMLRFYDRVYETFNHTKEIDIVYLDFQKAFDKVSHRNLILKLDAMGIRDNVLLWIKNWLCNRMQRVTLNGESSDWANVGSGVPQGSVLGPLFFVLYINDIDKNVKNKLAIYADDTKIWSESQSHETLQNDLNSISEWARIWEMKFNVSKCPVVRHVGKNNEHKLYKMNEQILEKSNSERDLGVLINNDLKHSKQCDSAIKKRLTEIWD